MPDRFDDEAHNVFYKIVADLTDRSGLSGEWDAIDENTREEIRSAWCAIIASSMRSAVPPAEKTLQVGDKGHLEAAEAILGPTCSPEEAERRRRQARVTIAEMERPKGHRDDKETGLYRKYVVERTDGSSGPGGKHEQCDYFVLDLVHDRHAKTALEAYAESCRDEFPLLYDDLNDKLASQLNRTCIGTHESRVANRKEGKEEWCNKPAVIPLGNGVWWCVEHAQDESVFRLLSKRGLATLNRRLERVK